MNQWLLSYYIIILLYFVNLIHYCTCNADNASSSIIEVSYYYAYEHNTIPIIAGLNTEVFYCKIDLLQEGSWLSFFNASQYNYNNTIILKDEYEFNYTDNLYKAQLIKDTFGFFKEQQILFQFSIANQIPNSYQSSYQGVLGQQFSFSDTNLSFIHRLKEEGFIDHLSFSFSNRSKLYLGGIPNKQINGSYKSYCNVIEMNNSWNCMLNGVLLHNNTNELFSYPMTTPSMITFTTDRNKNYVPQAFFDFMVNEFFKERIDNGDFRISTFKNKTHVFSLDNIRKSGFIVMTIEDYSYTINIEEFWDCYEFGCDLNIFVNPYGDYWIIGHNFYQYYYITFNYEDKRIEFYSDWGVERVKDNGVVDYNIYRSNRVLKGMMIFDISILVIGVIVMIMSNNVLKIKI